MFIGSPCQMAVCHWSLSVAWTNDEWWLMLKHFSYSYNVVRCNMLHFAGIRHAEWNGTWYFFSWEHPQTRNATATWFQARNVCRRHCMDSVSLGAFAKVELDDVFLPLQLQM